jgi:hypothetical protein
MYYVKHVTAAGTGPLVLAACLLLSYAVNGPVNFTNVVAVIVIAQLLFPLFLLVSTVIGNNVKVVSGVPGSVRIACVAFVLTFVLPAVLSLIFSGRLNLQGEWLGAAAFTVGCWGSYILYRSIRPKQKLELRL